ncbi:MAG: hypothetical protein HQ469_11220 [Cyanobacteria bacterium]|nr:hypothetical protein [Cyanobacteria bacterium bin.275]
MIYSTRVGVQVHVLKEYEKTPVTGNRVADILLYDFDCIQHLSSGQKAVCEAYDLHKGKLAGYIRMVIPESFCPRFVVAPPSSRIIAGELAESLAQLYGCENLSGYFQKQNPKLRAGTRQADTSTLVDNLTCSASLGCIQSGDSILIIDDVYSTGKSIDAMKEKICVASGAQGLHFLGAAILAVCTSPTPSPSTPGH